MEKVADFHCDLLMYLGADPERTPNDPESRTSLPQFREGGVVLQTLAIFVETQPSSVQEGETQFQIFKRLRDEKGIRFVLSLENASSFCDETESLEQGLKRLERRLQEAGQIAYISLTWNEENRFGGGNRTHVGLKKDGEALLQWMNGKNIAVDFSHTSDALAYDILKYLDRHQLKITPVASHSNFRKVCDVPRNLPDDIAQEIVRRGGLIGLNFVRAFLGKGGVEDILKHVAHAKEIGVFPRLCFGADIFDEREASPELERPIFHPGYETADCYPRILQLLRQQEDEATLKKIAHDNLASFLT